MSTSFQEIDLTYLKSIANGDQEIFIELITIFLDQVPEFTAGLDKCFVQGDWNGIAAIAHKAKSSVLAVGLDDLANTDLKNLELLAKYFRILELQEKKPTSSTCQEEITRLTRVIESYPMQRQLWVKNNAREDILDSIIEKFKVACQKACNELENVLKRNELC